MTDERARPRPKPGDIRALAIDIDGTLADDRRMISLDAIASLREVESSGIPVMLASGNVLPIAYALTNYLGFTGPIIAENGGIVSHRQKVWVLGDPGPPRRAYDYLCTNMVAEKLFTDRWRETEVGLKREVSLENVQELLRGHPVDVQTTGYAIHIMQKGMDKFLGVRKGAELLGTDVSHVAAIGDSDNDERMIRECGFGVAVANAFEGTKSVASHVTESSDGKGVVEALKWLGLLRS